MSSYFEAKAVNGPLVVDWLEVSGYMPERPESIDATLARMIRKWRAGEWPPVEAVDKICVLLGVLWSEMPDDVWADEAPQDFPPRACAICGVDMPRRSRPKTNSSGTYMIAETANEYRTRRTCSHECGVELAARTRKAKLA